MEQFFQQLQKNFSPLFTKNRNNLLTRKIWETKNLTERMVGANFLIHSYSRKEKNLKILKNGRTTHFLLKSFRLKVDKIPKTQSTCGVSDHLKLEPLNHRIRNRFSKDRVRNRHDCAKCVTELIGAEPRTGVHGWAPASPLYKVGAPVHPADVWQGADSWTDLAIPTLGDFHPFSPVLPGP